MSGLVEDTLVRAVGNAVAEIGALLKVVVHAHCELEVVTVRENYKVLAHADGAALLEVTEELYNRRPLARRLEPEPPFAFDVCEEEVLLARSDGNLLLAVQERGQRRHLLRAETDEKHLLIA